MSAHFLRLIQILMVEDGCRDNGGQRPTVSWAQHVKSEAQSSAQFAALSFLGFETGTHLLLG